MSRLSPLIIRQVGAQPALRGYGADDAAEAGGSRSLDDLKLFATGWIGGLVFFGTLFS